SAIQVYGHELIILDEPSSNLDFNTIFKIQQMIKIWKNEGKTIIIAEHRLHYLTEVADRFIIMKDGKINEIYENEQFNAILNIKRKKSNKSDKNESKTINIAKHHLHYLTEVADRFIIMKDGKISEIYENEQFNALSNKQLATLGLRNIHLEQLNVKAKRNNKL